MTTYDPNVIEKFASSLYVRASLIVVMTTTVFAIVGAVGAYFLFRSTGGTFGGFFVGGLVGVYFGQHRAFALKLQAQMALCQVQIEKNTRRQEDRLESAGLPSDSNSIDVLKIDPSWQVQTDTEIPSKLGKCTSCNAQIRTQSTSCPNCNATFGGKSKWRVEVEVA